MIFSEIMGGLGNQMFGYAFVRALQLETGEPAALLDRQLVPKTDGKREIEYLSIAADGITFLDSEEPILARCGGLYRRFQKAHRFYDVVNGRLNALSPWVQRVTQPALNYFGMACVTNGYAPVRRRAHTEDMICFGWFQDARYFEKHAAAIRRELRVAGPVPEANRAYLERIRTSESVCVHVRRGDYASPAYQDAYLVCTPDYYERAMADLRTRVPGAAFFVFSDDIEWARQHIRWPENTVFITQRNTPHEDMRLMYGCRHFVISNSSYSWWAQYLGDAPDKLVFAPDRWYNNHQYRADLYQSGWIRVPV